MSEKELEDLIHRLQEKLDRVKYYNERIDNCYAFLCELIAELKRIKNGAHE